MTKPTLTGELPLTPPTGGEGVPDFEEKKHRYSLDSKPLDGVTGILKVLDKPALPWWGMRIGIAGIVTLLERLGPDFPDTSDEIAAMLDIEQLLKDHKLTVNHVKEDAGARGSAAHDQLEEYAVNDRLLRPSKAPVAAQGYLRSAAMMLAETKPEYLASEVMVWSREHWYAGTFDAIVRYLGDLELWDYKSSKNGYETHALQMGAYERARRELGLEPIRKGRVVLLTADGDFDIESDFIEVDLDAMVDLFLPIKHAHDAMNAPAMKAMRSTLNKSKKRRDPRQPDWATALKRAA